MDGLAIGIRYLTGYAVATDPASREKAEWPPHPARVFMAMAAAYFETGEGSTEADALRWLETLPTPEVHATGEDRRSVVTTFVPVNDEPTGSGIVHAVPGLSRTRQPRTFPCVRPHDDTVYLHWPEAELDEHREALQRLCRKTTRIGHSSSLVETWLEDELPEDLPHRRWEPGDEGADLRLRIVASGTLDYLQQQCGGHARREYQHSTDQLRELEADKEALKATGSREEKNALQQQIEALKAQLPDPPPRDPIRPVMSLWQGYRLFRPTLDTEAPSTVWDSYMVVRRLERGSSHHSRLDILATLQVTGAMHKAILEKAADPVPEFISGHKPDGSPSDASHLAFFPLPFVGSKHATGHLLGVGVAIPAHLNRDQRLAALAAIGLVEELTMGALGVWKLDQDDSGRVNLRAEVWAGGDHGASQWGTVTPIAFDRHPKEKDRAKREHELMKMIVVGCERIGLPTPAQVVVTPVSPHLGTPAAHEFPRLKRKDGSRRRHVHAIIIFDRPVRGPIAVGAGRYRGYGFCRPLRTGGETSW